MLSGHPEMGRGKKKSFTLLTSVESKLSADHFDLSPVYLSEWLFALSQCLEQLQGKGLFTLLHHIQIIYFYNCAKLFKENKGWRRNTEQK